jgi:3-hydroxyacyl-CoA dehydrogenase
MLRFLLQGELPEQVDAVITKFGMPMGPAMLIWPDFILVGARARTAAKSLRSRMLCEAGRFAQKTGKGCYRYEQGLRSPLPDPDVEKFITARLAKPTSIVGADVRIVCSVPRSLVLSRTRVIARN